MEAIGAASAIIGVAQFGLQFSQVLVTVIGDYRDAAKNINRLRDEIHLAAICLQQLGDLADRGLLREYGVLEATNLKDRCQAVFWEIRSTIRKGSSSLHPAQVQKEQIDVSSFMSIKWALYTKNKLEEPRQELDRLKDSMTLCFVSHMAILATTEAEKTKYASQIPGIKRSLAWSEGSADEDYFRKRLEAAGIPANKINEVLGLEVVEDDMNVDTLEPIPPVVAPQQIDAVPIIKAWSIDPLTEIRELPLATDWTRRFLDENSAGDKDIWDIQSKLHPWFKRALDGVFQRQSNDDTYIWTLVYLKPVFRRLIKRGMPKSLQVVMKGVPKAANDVEPQFASLAPEAATYGLEEPMPNEWSRIGGDITASEQVISIEQPQIEEQETDSEIIAKQLALYQ